MSLLDYKSMLIEVVIGANYGDEGKGLFTEYLCRNRKNPIVVLSNGGCQRGHTVNNVEKGIRHVFHHFGSGTLLGVPTVFSANYLLNPMKYVEEKKELEACGIKPTTFRAPDCLMQLPSDMFINQMQEKHRRKTYEQHGSCGWGIWQTLVRNSSYEGLCLERFFDKDFASLMIYMDDVLEWQIEHELKPMNAEIDMKCYHALKSTGFKTHFFQDALELLKSSQVLETSSILESFHHENVPKGCDFKVDTIIVENAQGLLLDKQYAPHDQNGRTDIHTTPSRTGLDGALLSIDDFNPTWSTVNAVASSVVANYITRSYFTRHGAGPFPEQDASIFFEDKTNIPNDYQESLRFGKFTDEAILKLLNRIERDACHSPIYATKNLVATHMNEIENKYFKHYANYLSYEDDSRTIKGRKS